MTKEIRKSDVAGIPLASIRSDTVCLVIFMLSHSAGARRRTGFGGLGCLCCWQEQVKEQTEILLWECVCCAHLQGRIMDFFCLFVCFLNACEVNHSFLHLLLAQYDLWFLLIRFLRTWHRSTLCLRWITHTCWTWFCFRSGELCYQMTTQTALRLTFIILMFPWA